MKHATRPRALHLRPAPAVPENHHRAARAGTRTGSLRETQEMLDFCAAHGIGAEVEVIHADQIDMAYARLLAGDVRYRFVIDIATMQAA